MTLFVGIQARNIAIQLYYRKSLRFQEGLGCWMLAGGDKKQELVTDFL